jgi:hypothetical protein
MPLARYGAIEGALRERHKTKNLHHHLGHNRHRGAKSAGLFFGRAPDITTRSTEKRFISTRQ